MSSDPQQPQPQDDPVQPKADTGPDGPEPVAADDPGLRAITALGVGAAALGGLFTLSALTARPTCGATRSAKLEFERRAAAIEQAIRDQREQGCGEAESPQADPRAEP